MRGCRSFSSAVILGRYCRLTGLGLGLGFRWPDSLLMLGMGGGLFCRVVRMLFLLLRLVVVVVVHAFLVRAVRAASLGLRFLLDFFSPVVVVQFATGFRVLSSRYYWLHSVVAIVIAMAIDLVALRFATRRHRDCRRFCAVLRVREALPQVSTLDTMRVIYCEVIGPSCGVELSIGP